MKIVVLGTRGFPKVQGGVEAHCENLYPALVKKGCEVIVLTRKPYVDPDLRSYKGVRLIPIRCLKNKFLEALLHTFFGILKAKKLNPDILHIHAIGPSVFTPLAKILGLKVVVTNHGPDYDRQKWNRFAKTFLKIAERLGSKRADKVIAISSTITNYLEVKYNIRPAVIPNGVILHTLVNGETVMRQYDITKHKYVLAVGRLVPEKGLHDLITAFNMIADRDGWKLVLVGRPDHEDQYSRSLRIAAGKNKDILLTGFLTGKPLCALYQYRGLFVLPSYHEGLPIALLEALSYGDSCLVSDISANREVGLPPFRYFKVGDTEALANKLKYFMTTENDEGIDIVERARILQKYNWEKISEQTLSVYQEITGPPLGQPSGLIRRVSSGERKNIEPCHERA